MKKRVLFFTYYYLFFILYFILAKVLFLLFYFNQSSVLGIGEWLRIIYHGFRLDLSAASYIMIFPASVLALTNWFKPEIATKIVKVYTWIIIIIINLIIVSDIELFKYWGFRLDTTPLMYLNTPKEMLINAPVIVYLKQLGLAAVLTAGCMWFLNKKIISLLNNAINYRLATSALLVISFFALIIPIRGGLGVSTNNTGSVYYHSNPFVNQAALNVLWNVGYSLTKMSPGSNPYDFFSPEDAKNKINYMTEQAQPGNDASIFRTKNPNIILIILESFTSKVIGTNDFGEEITPNFNGLIRDGVYFKNFYASGDRSDKALPAIFSGFPAMPTESIIKHPAKTQQLPFITKDFLKNGYKTAFYYGGEINFANFNSYIINAGFQKIISNNDFEQSLHKSKWGVPDEYVFKKLAEDVKSAQHPFFYSLFSLSSHDPFDIPNQSCTDVNNRDLRFINSLRYTDQCLGNFIKEIKRSQIWDSTLIIIMADHSNILPGNSPNSDTVSFRIPMLWLGGTLSIQDSVCERYLSQTDLAALIFQQLNLSSEDFIWSNSYNNYVTYAYRQGIGFINKDFNVTYFRDNDSAVFIKGNYSQALVDMVKARYQGIYDDFLNK
jgi:phosphoglycerol transferase MdoB-like AlkP superfamily enzyme